MRILLFFHNGSKNRGCEAIVRTAAKLLKSDPRVTKLGLASIDPESDKMIPLIDVLHLDQNSTIEKYSPIGIRNAFHIKFLKDESFAFRNIHESIIKLIPQYDVFLSIGGDNYCYGEQPGIYEIDRCIKKAGKKLVLWGASIGKEDLSEKKIKDLDSFDLILVRESLSEKVLKDAGIKSVHLVADGAFLLEKSEISLPENWKEGKTIGFNFSPLVFQRNLESKKAAFDLIEHIIKTTDYQICLTPHVMMDGNNDHETLKEFYEHFKDSNRMVLLSNDLNAIELKFIISKMKFFIGARTHATIAAYSSLVPTLVLGYSIKSKGIAQDIFGEEKLVLGIDEISNSDKLIAKFEEMKSEEKELYETLEKRIPEIKDKAKKALEYLMK